MILANPNPQKAEKMTTYFTSLKGWSKFVLWRGVVGISPRPNAARRKEEREVGEMAHVPKAKEREQGASPSPGIYHYETSLQGKVPVRVRVLGLASDGRVL